MTPSIDLMISLCPNLDVLVIKVDSTGVSPLASA